VRYKQAGRGGIGAVFRNKKLKAVVAKFSNLGANTNAPAHPDILREVGPAYNREIRRLDPQQNRMAVVGTTHLVPIMNEFDLLPVHNFKFGSHPAASKIGEAVYKTKFDPGFDGCWVGCAVACAHGVKGFQLTTGPYKGQRVFVDGPEYETIAGLGSNCGIFDPDYLIEMNFYCDTYGLDTISVGTAIAFAMECYEMNLIDKHATGGLELRFGNKDAALALVHQMATGEGFGVTVGQGIRRMKQIFAEAYGDETAIMKEIGKEAKGLEFTE
jgi:aldehyde:ferredoxin oxidoreductase